MTKYTTAKDPTAFLGLTLIMFYLFRFGKIVYRGSGVAIGEPGYRWPGAPDGKAPLVSPLLVS